MAVVFIDGFEIDAAAQEEHSFDSEVTEYPVEKGADIADHVRSRPIVVTIEGIVSDTPLGSLRERRITEFGDPLVAGDVSEGMFAKLQKIRDAREPVTIVTSLRKYDNMVLQSISIPRDATTGDALRFRAQFIQIVLVTNARTVIRTAEPGGKKKTDQGNKPTAPVPANAAPKVAPTVNTRKPPVRRVPATGGGETPPGEVVVGRPSGSLSPFSN